MRVSETMLTRPSTRSFVLKVLEGSTKIIRQVLVLRDYMYIVYEIIITGKSREITINGQVLNRNFRNGQGILP